MEFLWFLEQFRNPITNGIFQFFTLFGEELLVIGIVCVLFWCFDKNMALRMGLSYFIAGLLVQFLKIVFCIPRPWILDKTFKPVGSAVETATGYSFPSGHSQGAASLWGTVSASTKKKRAKIVCITIALLTGLSRMFLGVHTPKDVLVGLLIGFLAALFVCNDKTEEFVEKHQSIVSLILGIISLALIGFAAYRITFAGVEAEEGIDCCKAAGAGFGFAVSWYIEEQFVCWEPKTFFAKLSTKCRKNTSMLQVIVFFFGLVIALALKSGLKKLFGVGVIVSALQYAILIVWIVALYPAILMRYVKKN